MSEMQYFRQNILQLFHLDAHFIFATTIALATIKFIKRLAVLWKGH